MIFKRKIKVVTHSGSFHADDLFASAVVTLYYKKRGRKVSFIRTRDEEKIKKADLVFDVGNVYDDVKMRFDHHQTGGAGKRDNGIPYASFGLVWKKFGLDLCHGKQDIVDDIDRRLVQPVDAIDNGISVSEPADCGLFDYGLYGIISAYQNTWKEVSQDGKQQKNFLKLVDFFADLLKNEIKRTSDRLELLEKIQEAYNKSERKDVIEIPYHVGIGPVTQVLHKYPEVLYVVARSNVNWKVMAMRKNPCDFENRKSLPQSWSGKRNNEMAEISGVSDAIFCHNALWMAVAESKEGAWKLADIATHL